MTTRMAFCGAAFLAALALLGTGGCGSSGSSAPVTSTGNHITRATENTFSASARVLAARVADKNGDTWLSADVARQFDTDIAAVRAANADVASIEARPEYDLRSVVVNVPTAAPWSANWDAGNATTGEAQLDALLTEFAPEQIVAIGKSPDGTTGFYTLKFGQSLNMPLLAQRLKAASTSILSATPNYTAGDGDNIAFLATAANGSRQYAFSRGSGDCPAGCINRHTWEYTVSADSKTATLTNESGSPTIGTL